MMQRTKYMAAVVCLAAVFLAGARAHGQTNAPPPPDRQAQPALRVSLRLTRPSLAGIVTELGRKYNINLAADAFLNDESPQHDLQVRDMPLRDLLIQIGNTYSRDVLFINGIVVLRHPYRAYQFKMDRENAQRSRWNDRGQVTVTPLRGAPKTFAARPPRVNAKIEPTALPEEIDFPARLLSMEAAMAPAGDVAALFSEKTGWKVAVDPSLADRRVSVQLHRVSPGQAIQALTMLLNATPTVTIQQSEAQRKSDSERLKDLLERRTPRTRESDQLKEKLLSLLTPEQRAKLQGGEEVDIKISSLPTDLRKLAVQYIDTAFREILQITTLPYQLEPGMYPDFTIRISPNPMSLLIVSGRDSTLQHNVSF